MATIRAVVFDLGHTVWDFAPREDARRLTVLRVFEKLQDTLEGDVPSPATLDRALGATIARWLKSWDDPDMLEQPPTERLVAEALDELGLTPPDSVIRDLTTILFGTEVDMPVIEPDSLAAIDHLHQRGLVMGCVTNTILLEEGIKDALTRLGLIRYLRSIIVSSAMSYRKPHGSLFLRALEELCAPPHETLFVGDRLIDDIGGAQNVGMRAVPTHQYRQEPLDDSAIVPDAVIGRLAELPTAIAAIEAQG